ncbi:CvpA family protein [Desulfovibrio intestinalis]|uniref:Membrane protein required for colicin V production n=1 Tax=Desulfovibrio intestinalis TaxID=58621 RepID=A0A7W8C2V3_9BACT|nr:membrane protein required for colicin V production [Desulfovibrio intestinalis]
MTDAAKDTFQGESMGQDIFDLIVVLTLAFFAGRGYINGFVGEVAGIVSLLGGFWVAHNYHDMLSPHLAFITDPGWRTIAAYVLVFLGVLIAVALLARLLQKILSFSFVSWADRMAGAALGLAKGALLWSLGMIVLQKFFSHAAFMQHSRVLPYFTALTAQVRGWLPPDLVSRLGL